MCPFYETSRPTLHVSTIVNRTSKVSLKIQRKEFYELSSHFHTTTCSLERCCVNNMTLMFFPSQYSFSVDGCDEKPCEIKSDEAEDGNESQYSVNQNDSCEVKPTPPSQKKRTLQMKKDEKLLISSPSLERLKIKVET